MRATASASWQERLQRQTWLEISRYHIARRFFSSPATRSYGSGRSNRWIVLYTLLWYAMDSQTLSCSWRLGLLTPPRQDRGTLPPPKVPLPRRPEGSNPKRSWYGVERHAIAAGRHAARVKSHRAAPSARQTRRNARGEEARDKEKPLTAQPRRPRTAQEHWTPRAATRPASARRSV